MKRHVGLRSRVADMLGSWLEEILAGSTEVPLEKSEPLSES